MADLKTVVIGAFPVSASYKVLGTLVDPLHCYEPFWALPNKVKEVDHITVAMLLGL